MFELVFSKTILFSTIICISLSILLHKFLRYPSKIKTLGPLNRDKQYAIYITNIISFLHSCVMISLSLTQLKPFDPKNILIPNSNANILIMQISLGYFIFDTIAGLYYKIIELPMFIHHLLALGIYIYVLEKNLFANKILQLLWIGEISAPFLFIYENLDKHKKYENLSKIFGFLFCFVYLIARLYFHPFEHMILMNYYEFPLVIKFFSIAIAFISWSWAMKIFNKLVKAINDLTKLEIVNMFYKQLKKLRSVKGFSQIFHIFIGALASGPLLKMRFDYFY